MPQITKFCIDKKHRKAYVANNMGQINVINCQNGVVLKEVTLGAAYDHSQESVELLTIEDQEEEKSICLNDQNDEEDILNEDFKDIEMIRREIQKKRAIGLEDKRVINVHQTLNNRT
jgi:hypothetical protein